MRVRATAFCVIALLVAVVLAATIPGAGAVTAAQDGPTVRVTDASVDPRGTTTVSVVLTSAPDGLAGYELALSIEGDAATIAGVDYADGLGLTTEPAVSEDGRTVRLEAADVDGNVEAGATDVALATVELRGESAGRARLEARPVQFDADGGDRMDVGAGSGAVVVGEPSPTATATPDPTPTATVAGSTAAADGSTDTPATGSSTPTSTSTDTTSGQGGLPLAGAGVAAAALASIALLLARRR